MKKIIITGATSTIGVATIEVALDNNIERIYAVVRPKSKNLYRLPNDDRIVIIECLADDYRNLGNMISEKCDVFYHMACNSPGADRDANVFEQSKNILYTLYAVQAAKDLECPKFIGTGSQAEYGKLNLDMISPTSPAEPLTPYGISKYASGKLANIECLRLDIDCIWVRVFSVYGKYERATNMIPFSIKKMLMGEELQFTAAEQLWDYLYSEDAGKAFYLIGEKVSGNKVYCLGSGKSRPLYEYIKIMRNAISPSIELGIGKIPYNENTVMNICADIRQLTQDTGWVPQISFEEGIKRTIAFVSENILKK